MQTNRQSLAQLLLNNVCEVKFLRRRQKPGQPATRRMLCTKSSELLNSVNGRVVLNYRPPTHQSKINESRDNALVVWDIFVQDFRVVSMDNCELIRQFPADESFWEYFNEYIFPMSEAQKIQFMDS